jgi:hypothetical protein
LQLILHVGTTKTGTTTLQFAMNASRQRLLARGILYPDVDLNPGPSPKHQWLTNLLLAEDLDRFSRNVDEVARQARSTNATRVVMSTEGLFNHWFDFSPAARRALAALMERFDVTVWVVFREPVAWAMSMYVQAVKNPPFALAPVYSTTEPPEAVIDHAYFATRLDYARFVTDAESIFGTGKVLPTKYESAEILAQARHLLGVEASTLASAGDKNRALSVLGLDLMRRLNSLSIPWQERDAVASSIVALDGILGATSVPVEPSAEVAAKVLALSQDSESDLKRRFGIDWAAERQADVAR